MSRHFVLLSRTGRTDARFHSLREGGRLDIVYQCALFALFRAHGHRKDTVFTACLAGPPRPPLAMSISGSHLRNVRIDERTWECALREVLSQKPYPGFSVSRQSFQDVVRTAGEVYVLHEGGEPIENIPIGNDPCFVLGDHVGLPKKDEAFALRFGKKVSLGKNRSYLASFCISAIQYILDKREDATEGTEGPVGTGLSKDALRGTESPSKGKGPGRSTRLTSPSTSFGKTKSL